MDFGSDEPQNDANNYRYTFVVASSDVKAVMLVAIASYTRDIDSCVPLSRFLACSLHLRSLDPIHYCYRCLPRTLKMWVLARDPVHHYYGYDESVAKVEVSWDDESVHVYDIPFGNYDEMNSSRVEHDFYDKDNEGAN